MMGIQGALVLHGQGWALLFLRAFLQQSLALSCTARTAGSAGWGCGMCVSLETGHWRYLLERKHPAPHPTTAPTNPANITHAPGVVSRTGRSCGCWIHTTYPPVPHKYTQPTHISPTPNPTWRVSRELGWQKLWMLPALAIFMKCSPVRPARAGGQARRL